MKSFIETTTEEIKDRVDDRKVVCGISGGVDSTVAAVLVHRAIGKQLTCIFVDNGVLREGEAKKVEETLRKHFHMNIDCRRCLRKVPEKIERCHRPGKKEKDYRK